MNERFYLLKIQLIDKEDGLVCGKYRLGDLIKQNGRTFSYLYME